jgi:hypothetical protein
VSAQILLGAEHYVTDALADSGIEHRLSARSTAAKKTPVDPVFNGHSSSSPNTVAVRIGEYRCSLAHP